MSDQQETWLTEMGLEGFLDSFEALKGGSGLFKLDLEKLLPFQKEIFIFDTDAMEGIKRGLYPEASHRGFFDRSVLASEMQRTLMVIDKEEGDLIFQSGKERNATFSLKKDVLQVLIRHLVASREGPSDEDFPVYEFEDPAYVSVGLQGWGYEDTFVGINADIQEDFVKQLKKHDGLGDLFSISQELNEGFVLLDRSKKRLGFITPAREDWFVKLPYAAALDLFGELKALGKG